MHVLGQLDATFVDDVDALADLPLAEEHSPRLVYFSVLLDELTPVSIGA